MNEGVDTVEHGSYLNEASLAESGTYLVPTLSVVQTILRHADDPRADARKMERAHEVAEVHPQVVDLAYRAGRPWEPEPI